MIQQNWDLPVATSIRIWDTWADQLVKGRVWPFDVLPGGGNIEE